MDVGHIVQVWASEGDAKVYGGKGDKKHVHGPDVGDVTRPKEAVGVDVEKARVRRARGGGGW